MNKLAFPRPGLADRLPAARPGMEEDKGVAGKLSWWRQLGAAPHRLMFLFGALQAVGAMLWWLVDLLGRYGQVYAPLPWTIPPAWGHAFLLIYGFFPFYIFGFLMTTYPNWLNGAKVPPARFVPAALLMATGMLLFYVGLVAGRALLPGAVLLLLAGWGLGLAALLEIQGRSREADKRHARITSLGLSLGWLGAAAFGLGLLGGNPRWIEISRSVGIWLFLLPVFFAVSHRMIPFFSSRVLAPYTLYRPYWVLGAVLAGAAGHVLLDLVDLIAWRWLVDLPLLAIAVLLSWRWGLRRSLQARLLAVLHLSFLWLAVALALYGLQSLGALRDPAGMPFGLAPLHALAIGFFASMVIGMASRVTLGHSGRPLVADAITWALFLGMQATALLRVLPDLDLPLSPRLAYPLAAVVWLASVGPWAAKYAPLYWRPRADGKPG